MNADTPINDPSQDLLHRGPIAERIADIILKRPGPDALVLALHGPWGSGKSSVLHLSKGLIKAMQPDAIILDFDPWFFNDDESLIRNFFSTAFLALERAGAKQKKVKYELQARDPRGSSIEKSLSYHDLFSLDVVSSSMRNNLEALFHRYENDIAAHSRALLAKLAAGDKDLKKEIIGIFAAKLVNFLRNPFSIRKVLNTFKPAALCRFTNPALAVEFDVAIKGSRPQRDRVCARFGITGEEYDRWLRVLFLLLTNAPAQPLNLFEEVVKGVLESNWTQVFVAEETSTDPDRVFLLSDRGYNEFSSDLIALGFGEAVTFEFNVSARACVSFTLADPTPLVTSGRLPAAAVDDALRENARVSHLRDNRDFLVHYNQRTVSHCAEMVFSASARPIPA
jgi:hypothetical protein